MRLVDFMLDANIFEDLLSFLFFMTLSCLSNSFSTIRIFASGVSVWISGGFKLFAIPDIADIGYYGILDIQKIYIKKNVYYTLRAPPKYTLLREYLDIMTKTK